MSKALSLDELRRMIGTARMGQEEIMQKRPARKECDKNADQEQTTDDERGRGREGRGTFWQRDAVIENAGGCVMLVVLL